MTVIRNGTLTAGTAIVSAMARTDDLAAGLAVYGANIPVDTHIKTVDSATQVTLDRNCTLVVPPPPPVPPTPPPPTATVSLEFTNAIIGVYCERVQAQADVKQVIDERGDLIQFILRHESKVDRDAYGSIKERDQETVINLRSYPVEYSPSQKTLEKAGIHESCDVVIYTAFLDWITAGIAFADIDIIRSTVRVQGQVYDVKEKTQVSQFNDSFLYITFGLKRR